MIDHRLRLRAQEPAVVIRSGFRPAPAEPRRRVDWLNAATWLLGPPLGWLAIVAAVALVAHAIGDAIGWKIH